MDEDNTNLRMRDIAYLIHRDVVDLPMNRAAADLAQTRGEALQPRGCS